MIRGTKRSVLRKTLDLRASIHNRFDVEVRDAVTGELKQQARGYNVICDTLWDRLFYIHNGSLRPQNYFSYVVYGSGSGTPSASDTALFSQLGYRYCENNTTLADAQERGIFWRQGVVTLQAADNVGDTITEVGIAYDQTHIVTHAMLEDMNGNPISIAKTDTDVILIYATVYVHFPPGGWYGGSVSISRIDVAGNPDWFATLTGITPASSTQTHYWNRQGAGRRTGSYTSANAHMSVAVDRANKKITLTNRLEAAQLNLPIRSLPIAWQYSASGNYYGDPVFWVTPGSWFTPLEIKAEAVGTGDGTTTGFATAFPVKTGSKVYVDGVEASGVTFRPGPADAARMEYWLNTCNSVTIAGLRIYDKGAYEINADRGLTITSLQSNYRTLGLENPFTAIGIASISARIATGSDGVLTVQCSDDLVSWTDAGTLSNLGTTAQTLSIPQALRTKRYWRLVNAAASTKSYYARFVADVPDTAHNIVFASPPAAGAVITCDYVPDCIAKDSNHVFDLTLELTLGEYQEV